MLRVHASPRETYDALRTTDLASAPIARLVLLLRALPGALLEGRAGAGSLRRRATEPVTLATFEKRGFQVIAERPPVELVIGLEGRFWRPDGGVCTPPVDAFRTQSASPGTARAVWNFSLEPREDGGTELRTETRVLCADAATRLRFLPYWFLIRPGSGMIRRAMLKAIKSTAEGRGRVQR